MSPGVLFICTGYIRCITASKIKQTHGRIYHTFFQRGSENWIWLEIWKFSLGVFQSEFQAVQFVCVLMNLRLQKSRQSLQRVMQKSFPCFHVWVTARSWVLVDSQGCGGGGEGVMAAKREQPNRAPHGPRGSTSRWGRRRRGLASAPIIQQETGARQLLQAPAALRLP